MVFRHDLPFDRSSLTRWRQRLGEEQIAALLQESLSVAHRTGAIETKDLERVVVDTTVQEKAIAHPSDARLMHRAIEKLVDLAKREGIELRQSYLRVAKRAAIMVGRYTHAHQFKRARRELKFLRTRLGRIIRDIRRKIEGDPALEDRFGPLLDVAHRVRHQEQRQRGPKVYSLHAPEVECIGKGKARAPYEFGCKVSIATPATAPKGGQFVLHAKALHGNPYDGHTLGPVIADLEKLTGVAARRIHGDKGYRGHNYPDRFKVWISGQVRRVTKAIRREMRRRAAVEPVIGHLKDDHRMRRNHLKGRDGDRINAVLAAAGYNQPAPPLVHGTFTRPVMDTLSSPTATAPCVNGAQKRSSRTTTSFRIMDMVVSLASRERGPALTHRRSLCAPMALAPITSPALRLADGL